MTMLIRGQELKRVGKKKMYLKAQEKPLSNVGSSLVSVLPGQQFAHNTGVQSQGKAGTQTQAPLNSSRAVRSLEGKVGQETELAHRGKSQRGESKMQHQFSDQDGHQVTMQMLPKVAN